MGFGDGEFIKFKFSYGFFIDANETGNIQNKTAYECKERLSDSLNRTYNLSENLIDVCVNDYDTHFGNHRGENSVRFLFV